MKTGEFIRSTGPDALQTASQGHMDRDSYESDAMSAVELRGAISKEELDARHQVKRKLPSVSDHWDRLYLMEVEE